MKYTYIIPCVGTLSGLLLQVEGPFKSALWLFGTTVLLGKKTHIQGNYTLVVTRQLK